MAGSHAVRRRSTIQNPKSKIRSILRHADRRERGPPGGERRESGGGEAAPGGARGGGGGRLLGGRRRLPGAGVQGGFGGGVGRAEMGLLICGTGVGMSIAANKVKGVRAAVVHDEFTAQISRSHNNANVLCLSADLLGQKLI